MFEQIKTNVKLLLIIYKKNISIALAIFAFITYFYNADELVSFLNNIFKNSNYFFIKTALFIGIVVIGLIVLFFISLLMVIFKKSEVIIKNKLICEYNDIFKIKPKNNSIFVIPVNTAFDVIVDDDLTKASALVSSKTLHGQFIKDISKNISVVELDEMIKKSLSDFGYKPIKEISVKRGNSKLYPIGTIATIQNKNVYYYLLAISQFDKSNVAHSTKEDIITAIIALIKKYNENGQCNDLYIPLFGTGLSRSNISNKYIALQIIISIFKAYESEITGKVHIIIFDKEKSQIPLK